MNDQIKKLAELANKETRTIVGLMSGTSLDGLDIALCQCTGNGLNTNVSVLKFKTIPYDDHFKKEVREIFSRRDADLQTVCILNAKIGSFHADLINETLNEWGYPAEDVDLIASHGQTIFHSPASLHNLPGQPDATLQIGDADHIAVKTGIITLSDFRQKHIAAGGEGAPLAVYGDYLIFSKPGENRVMLNIGGIANFTYLPANGDSSKIFSSDVGPGNTLLDQYVQQNYPGLSYDEDARIARSGKLDEDLLMALLDHPFLDAAFPKTTGPELFNLKYLAQALKKSGAENISKEDVLYTLSSFTAESISQAINLSFTVDDSPCIYLSGGGMHNPLLLEILQNKLPHAKFSNTDSLGINPDAKEAVLFAVLANETVAGAPINLGNRKGIPEICMGKISLPK